MGDKSSDDEELEDVPDDDQYDTEDSFMDDSKLDEYFRVDKSPAKVSGFFISQGKSEQLNEYAQSAKQLPKKRSKHVSRALGDEDNLRLPKKNAKLGHSKMKAGSTNAPHVGQTQSGSSKFKGELVRNELPDLNVRDELPDLNVRDELPDLNVCNELRDLNVRNELPDLNVPWSHTPTEPPLEELWPTETMENQGIEDASFGAKECRIVYRRDMHSF